MNMADKAQENDATAPAGHPPASALPGAAAGVPRRGHRGTDARDAVAEMAARAQEISLEAGSKVSLAMKEIILGAAGLAGFAVESARDLVQYMVRRGQMTPEEGDKLLREAEEGYVKSGRPLHKPAPPPPRPSFAATPASAAPAIVPRPAPGPSAVVPPPRPVAKAPAAAPSAASPARPAAKSAPKSAAKAGSKSAGKAPTKSAARPAKKGASAAKSAKPAKKAAAKPPAKKGASASRAKPAKKGSAARKR
jgi:hypothetical protein